MPTTLNKSDIIEIKCRKKWFQKSLNYALISWSSTFNRMGKANPYSRIEKIIIGLIAEYAFEEYLKSQNYKYDKTGKTKWYEEDRFDLGYNEYAYDVKSNFLDLRNPYVNKNYDSLFTDKYDWFLKFTALVPLDQLNAGDNKRRKHDKKKKIYIFPFVEGIFDENMKSDCLVHAFWDYLWLKKGDYKDSDDLGELTITYDGKLKNTKLIIYGTSAHKKACIEVIDLDKRKIITKNTFYQVFSILNEGEKPDGTVKIIPANYKIQEIIKPINSFSTIKDKYDDIKVNENNWQNVMIYNCLNYLFGWMDDENIRIIGKTYPRFTHTIAQYQETQVDNWGVPVNKLYSINNLKNIYG